MNIQNTHKIAFFILVLSGFHVLAVEIREVDIGQPVKSAKRGVCLNEMSPADFMALSPSVSWWYNWHYEDKDPAPKEARMEFFPMVWGDRKADIKGLEAYLSKNKPRYVLGINEPNLKDQAFIPPQQTARLYRDIKAITDSHNIPLIAPNMSLGSPENGSIKAMDPVEKKEVVYTFQNPFLKAVFHYLGDVSPEAVASHSYGNLGELKWMTGMMHDEFKKPVWITEFAHWHAKNEQEELEYLVEAVDFFERTPYVQGYAWFKERVEGNPKLSLLGKSGELTRLGRAYVDMPVHDSAVYYRMPGRLQAESYTEAFNPSLHMTTDDSGFLEMRCSGPDQWLDYQVVLREPGTFTLRMRGAVPAPVRVNLWAGERMLAGLDFVGKGWQEASTRVELPAGRQTLRLRAAGAVKVNWLEFTPVR
jgi:hypothetical protein